MQHSQESKPVIFYFLMAFLTVGVTYIGYKFGGLLGGTIAFLFTAVVNGYAVTIKHD